MSSKKCIIWLRNDLRIADNLAFAEAVRTGVEVVAVYIWSPHEYGAWAPGGASRWWLANALRNLRESLESVGGRLVLRSGNSLETLLAISEGVGARRVLWNRRYESSLRERDSWIKRELSDKGYEVKSFNSSLLNEPHTVSSGSGKPYKVYTPYWKSLKDRPFLAPVEIDPSRINFYEGDIDGEDLSLDEIAPKGGWSRKFGCLWDVSEAGASKCLNDFLDRGILSYNTDRDVPSVAGTSSLSPYLHYGLIGPRQVVAQVRDTVDESQVGVHTFLKEIYWREFAYNVLYHFPHTQDHPLQEKYAKFPWAEDGDSLRAWQLGQTGYPIVDAGMRELWATGWMHNRVRMIVSSFLVKHLLQDWKHGAEWFWDTLVDADLASNSLGWQWSGGCGADAAPYFRIFNPMTQGKKFDPEGSYVRKWVPELSEVPNKYIHEPWMAPDGLLSAVGVTLGSDYPEPIVEHGFGRTRALDALSQLKEISA